MAAEHHRMLAEHLSQLPEGHPDRPILAGLKAVLEAYLFSHQPEIAHPVLTDPLFKIDIKNISVTVSRGKPGIGASQLTVEQALALGDDFKEVVYRMGKGTADELFQGIEKLLGDESLPLERQQSIKAHREKIQAFRQASMDRSIRTLLVCAFDVVTVSDLLNLPDAALEAYQRPEDGRWERIKRLSTDRFSKDRDTVNMSEIKLNQVAAIHELQTRYRR